ncbi:MAG TPA: S1C family serine protease [Acetobacteraceae bacterium]|jgi:S1-C subfamily serine protease|nr:S1C family serine protease [Acetobacteraceae bacterium]
MADEEDWTIPPDLRPDPADYRFDLAHALRSVVALKAQVPQDAFSARTLGTEREGSGVVIRHDGLILTIGYLVSEAEQVWITTSTGRVVPGHALAQDFETGFGLVQALGRLEAPAIELGDPLGPKTGAACILAAAAGEPSRETEGAVACTIAAREPFAGYWEYVLDEALFTAPAHPSWGGAALIGEEGRLAGIGSLVLQHRDPKGRRLDLNMVVPIGLLHPIMDDLLAYGRVNKPARPWLGLYAAEQEEGIVVASVAPRGPAEKAGLQAGDRIIGIGGEEAADLAGLWRSLWAKGSAGVRLTVEAERAGRRFSVPVLSADRASFLKAPRLH